MEVGVDKSPPEVVISWMQENHLSIKKNLRKFSEGKP